MLAIKTNLSPYWLDIIKIFNDEKNYISGSEGKNPRGIRATLEKNKNNPKKENQK